MKSTPHRAVPSATVLKLSALAVAVVLAGCGNDDDDPVPEYAATIRTTAYGVPHVLAAVNNIVSEVGANIEAQQLATTRDIGYLVMDVNRELSDEVHTRISALPMSVRTRILY